MKLNVISEEQEAYQNFIDSVRDKTTLKKYKGYLKEFLSLVPNEMFKEYLGHEPKSREIPDLANAFTELALSDVKNTKSIINAYVRELKKLLEQDQIKPATAKNKLKPIKKLFRANDVEMSWHLVDQSLPRPGKSGDRPYTLAELQNMIKASTKILDKVIVTMSASGGFRVEAWNYFTWKDLIFFKNDDGTYKGAALLIYRGDIEEYITFITPEACNYLEIYREEWKKRFFNYPKKDDPIILNVRHSRITRLEMNGVKARITNLAESIGLRPPLDGARRHEVMITHGFRKSWNTNMRRAKVDFADKEEMMGHAIAQEKSYQRYTEEDFEWFPEYQKAIPLLTISDEDRQKAAAVLKDKKIQELESKNDRINKMQEKLDYFEELWFNSNFKNN